MNMKTVDGYQAKIDYDADLDMFRGGILGLSVGPDFHGMNPNEGKSINTLDQEALKQFTPSAHQG